MPELLAPDSGIGVEAGKQIAECRHRRMLAHAYDGERGFQRFTARFADCHWD